jgi:hypothetical protein
VACVCCADGRMGSTPGTPSGQPGLVNLRQFCELMEDVLATRRCDESDVSMLCMRCEMNCIHSA